MQASRLEFVLNLLDEGLALYRRNFSLFVLVCAVWVVPLAILAGAVGIAASWLEEGVVVLLVLGAVLAGLVAVAYGLATLSQAAHAAASGQPISLGQALWIAPARLAGMVTFAIVYSILIYMVMLVMSIVCICPIYIFGFALVGLTIGAGGGGSISELFGMIAVVLLFGTSYLSMLALSGASLSSMIYALQPWAVERGGFGHALQRSFELIGYRFLRNLLAWAACAVVVGGIGFSITTLVGLAVTLPTGMRFGDESRLALGLSIAAWLLSLTLVLPPLPIWMALLYRRNLAARSGDDLEARVQRWVKMNVE
jgi:hypothetical protein